jgi:ERCC4-type nuclease
MEFFIDNRERHIIDEINKNNGNSNLLTKQLDIGDVNICYNKQIKIIIERKTLADLAQSMKDGRYKEQKTRLIEFRKQTNCKVIYLLENFISFDNDINIDKMKIFGLDILSFKNMFINSIIRDDIFIVNTSNLKETVDFLTSLIDQIKKKPEFITETQISEDYDNIYNKNAKKKKNDMDNILISQIACIPGFNIKHAKNIKQKFNVKTMSELINEIENQIENGIKNPLCEIKGIGNKMSTTFYNMIGILNK